MFQIFLKNSEINTNGKPAHRANWPEFLPLLGLPAIVSIFLSVLPPWVGMWLLAGAIYAGCKWLTWRHAASAEARPLRSAAYLFLWPGMDAHAFLSDTHIPRRIPITTWLFAIGKTLLGVGLLWVAAPRAYAVAPLFGGWVGMVGLIFLLHFGLFHILSLAWQSMGVTARPLMNWPVAARSLGNFWSERWNRGFNDIAVEHIFRPLHRRIGIPAAMLAAFLVSGMIHDAVITIPAGAGYGLPTLYFVIQAAGLLLERSALGRKMGLRHGVRGWLFTLTVAAAPVGLLFPPAFVERVMIPFFRFLHVL